MNAKQKKRAMKLLQTMESARDKQVRNIVKYERSGSTATGKSAYTTYERQCDLFQNASAELAKIIAGETA